MPETTDALPNVCSFCDRGGDSLSVYRGDSGFLDAVCSYCLADGEVSGER